MGVDLKYGRVTTERGTIGYGEPVVLFRAKDILLAKVLEYYRNLCEEYGSPDSHVCGVEDARSAVLKWQFENGAKTPD